MWIHMALLVAVQCHGAPLDVAPLEPRPVLLRTVSTARPVDAAPEHMDPAEEAPDDDAVAEAAPRAEHADPVADADVVPEQGSADLPTAAGSEEVSAAASQDRSDEAGTPEHDDLAGAATDAAAEAPREAPEDPVLPDPSDSHTERDADPEPEPEPEEPEPEPEDDTRWQKFVRTEDDSASRDDDAEFISAHDVEARVTMAAPVEQLEWGPRSNQVGDSDQRSSPAFTHRQGEHADKAGTAPQPAELAEQAEQGGGGGHRGEDAGRGALSDGGDRTQGGHAAPTSGGSASAAASPVSRPAVVGERDGAAGDTQWQEAQEPDPVADADLPKWWNPAARRLSPSDPAPPAPRPVPAVASPTAGQAVAVVERPGERADRGGTEASADEAASPQDADAPREAPAAQEVGVADPVADLQEFFGWGARDDDTPAGTPQSVGRRQGAAPASQQTVVPDEADPHYVSYVDAAQTPKGEYTEVAYQLVNERWFDEEGLLGLDDRALGIQGEVTIRFTIRRNGRVEDLKVVRSSGNPTLDLMALRSVPKRLPRLPRSLSAGTLKQEITLRYNNPLVDTRESP